MSRKTIKSLEGELKTIRELREYDRLEVKEKDAKIREMEIKLKFYQAIDQHFHMLLAGVCAGLKETANFPRNR